MEKEEKTIVEETKETEKVEETSTEKIETTKENITPVNMDVNIFEINKDLYCENIEEVVETKRKNVQKEYKKAKKISNIMTAIMVTLVIVAVVLVVQETPWMKYTGIGIGSACLIGMLVFYIVNRNKMPNLIENYMKDVSDLFNAYLYKDAKYENLSCDNKEKLEMGEPVSDRIYTGILSCGSRNIVKGSFMNHPIKISDIALAGAGEKSKQVDYFVGKYIQCENELKFDGRVIVNICLKGEKTFDLPTDIKDLQEEFHNEQMTIWATPGLDYKKIVTSDVLNKLNKLEVKEEKHLLNVNLVIWGGHCGAYLSYDNSLMSFPFQDEFKKDALAQFKKDQNVMFDIFEIFMKAKEIKMNKALIKEVKVEEEKPTEVKEVKTEETKVEDTKVNEPAEEKKEEK